MTKQYKNLSNEIYHKIGEDVRLHYNKGMMTFDIWLRVTANVYNPCLYSIGFLRTKTNNFILNRLS